LDSAYVYIRFSSPKQEKGDSKERQIKACLDHIRRMRWNLAEPVIADLGRSAWTGDHLKRGNLGRFAERVRSGEVPAGSILCVEALDRLSRQEWIEARDWLESMTKLGLKIATVQGERLYDWNRLRSPNGMIEVMEIMMRAIAANLYAVQLSDRKKSSWVKLRKLASEGHIISRHVPGWLEVVGQGEDRKCRWIDDHVDTVREIYRLSADGMGARTIARTLNERGYESFGKARRGWEHTYVSEILQSSAVEGAYEPKIGRHRSARKTGERFDAYFGDPVVDADLVARARAGVASRKGQGGRGRTQVRNLFSDLIRCGQCGGRMSLVGNSAKPARYLQCREAAGGRGCPQKRTFAYVPFENAALDALLPLALDDRHFTRPDHSHALAVNLAEARKTITLKKQDEARAAELLLRVESEALEQKLKDLQAERKFLEASLGKLENDLALARGAVSPQEHMKRVLGVRDALNHADEEVRLAARFKVADALRGLSIQVKCIISPEGTKSFVLYVMNGSLMVFINHEGERTSVLDFLDQDQLGGLFGMTDEDIREFQGRCEAHHGDEGWSSKVEFETFERRRADLLAELKRPIASPIGV